jgi:acyl-homoserine lactone acylase PvdQ
VRRTWFIAVVLAALAAFAAPAGARAPDVSLNVLAPGESGGLPPDAHSTDQLALYDSLTPLSGRHLSLAQVRSHFKAENFKPIGATTVEPTPRAGLTIKRDRWNVPHIYGRTRADAYYGLGWVAAHDRSLLTQLGRGAARAAAADVPGLNAFGLVTSGKTFTPSKQSEALLTHEQALLKRTYGAKGRAMIADMRAYAQGVTAQFRHAGIAMAPWTVNDEIAVTTFIGSIFGNGGGKEADNAGLLARMRQDLGARHGQGAWQDLMEANDPETPTTTEKTFRYGNPVGGPTPGSPLIDPGSLQLAADPSQRKLASNFLVVAPERSASGDPLAVMGPQLGYYYPEIVFEADVHAPGLRAQGAFTPGGGPYMLIGRTKNYAWSLTSASNDNQDEFLDRLCNPDGSAPTRESDHYRYKGRCRAMTTFDAGSIAGAGAATFRRTVHGPVVGTATIHGRPYAVARDRSTYGRDALSLGALRDMTMGLGSTPRKFFRAANQFGFTFNWPYVNRHHVAYFSTGRLPIRAPGTNPMLPTLGTGRYEWRGFLSLGRHPHDADPPEGLFYNWNNKPAKGWISGDDDHAYGSLHRVELYDHFPAKARLQDVVSIMNNAATQDLRAVKLWPVIRKVIAGTPAPDALTQTAASMITNWRRAGGSRLDSDLDGRIDQRGAAVMDAAWPLLAKAVMRGGLGRDTDAAADLIGVGGGASSGGSSFGGGWYGYVSKDLRRITGAKVRGPFKVRYCGGGDLARCRAAVWGALREAKDQLVAADGADPHSWYADATKERITFKPGLIPNSMRWTNRATFQQVLQLTH